MTETSETNAESESSEKKIEVEAIPSSSLLKGRDQVLIDHAGEIYRLSVTQNGKLVLHK